MNKIGFAVAAVAMLASIAPVAHASGEIYDNFTYQTDNGSTVSGDDAFFGYIGHQEVAVGFTPTQDYLLGSADLPFTYIYGGNGPITITAYSDAAGLPGTVLDSEVIASIDMDSSDPMVYNVVFTSHPTLLAGQQYWIGASATGDTFDSWMNIVSGSETTAYHNASDGPWGGPNGTSPALRVNGTPVAGAPEPSNLLVVGIGAGVLLSLGLRRRTMVTAVA